MSVEWKIIGDDKVSAIGLGTWAIRNYDQAYNAYLYALTNGINNIDTAEMYDSGRAEEFVGRLVHAVGRDNIFITTKILPDRLIDKDLVLKAGRAALKRLGVDYVDLYLIHWPNRNLSIEEQVRNFEILAKEGLTRYIGVSNFNVYELDKAIHSLARERIVAVQLHYSILHKSEVENEMLDYCRRNNIAIQAYTPLERGAVAGHPVVKQVADKYGKTPIQVALNYLISQGNVIPIPKAEKIEHVKEILGSMGWRMDVKDLEILRGI
ncbi:aldo/keto reductase [Thermogladius sp. 4427co]|uniref:aldo/keto reductase n=1 Tax=Thermogladius sp. 4427co TaxID=3450718 RepID=UPI003F7A61DC